ncbi:MAG TPA: hypothetical protein VHH34_15655, partial [Pseudonocardiaceae bacterium]|nr:hypothetical protein [Pseudonocardiaceae bacterium]
MTGAKRWTGATGPLVAAIGAVALVAILAAALGIGVPATAGAHVAVDETQYLLTALSLAQDGDLDIADELREQRWRAFADVEPPVQTVTRPGGGQISPHDPLLPLLLAPAAAAGGFVAAKLTLTLLSGVLAGLTLWVAVRRFDVPLPLAATGVGLAAASAPLAVYGQQLYPELPAALLALLAVVALTGPPPPRRRNLILLVAAVVMLPWLSVKYAPVAATLAVVGGLRWWWAGRHRDVLGTVAAFTLLGAGYLAAHRAVWGGWTVYASGDHFERTGEFSVVGTSPDYLGRSVRLVGLLVDRDFGLVAWAPGWLLLVPALAALPARSSRVSGAGRAALLAPLAVGWLVATFVALTMHGFWWPGRQVVVVAPLAVLVVLCWLAGSGRVVRAVAVALGVAGVLNYGWLLTDGYAGHLTWVFGFDTTGSPVYR